MFCKAQFHGTFSQCIAFVARAHDDQCDIVVQGPHLGESLKQQIDALLLDEPSHEQKDALSGKTVFRYVPVSQAPDSPQLFNKVVLLSDDRNGSTARPDAKALRIQLPCFLRDKYPSIGKGAEQPTGKASHRPVSGDGVAIVIGPYDARKAPAREELVQRDKRGGG